LKLQKGFQVLFSTTDEYNRLFPTAVKYVAQVNKINIHLDPISFMMRD